MPEPTSRRSFQSLIASWSRLEPVRDGELRLWGAAAAALTLVSLLPIWLFRFAPLQDYPYHLLRAHIIANFANPTFPYGRLFAVDLFPLPYILFDYLVLLGALVFPIPTAGKLVLTLYVVLFVCSVFYFVRGGGREQAVVGFLGFVLVYNWFFNKGFINYALGIPMSLFAVGFYQRHRDALTPRRGLILSGLILATYLAHLYAFCFLLIALVLVALPGGQALRRLAPLTLACLPTLALLVVAVTMHLPVYLGKTRLLVFAYPTLGRTLQLGAGAKLPYFTSFWPTRERWPLFAAAGVGLILILAGGRALFRNRSLILVAAFCALYLLLPEYVSPEYNFFACRVLIFIPLLALALMRAPRSPLGRGLVLAAAGGIALASLALTALAYASVEGGLQDYAAALSHIPAGQRICFAAEDHLAYVGRMSPFEFFHCYYYLQHPGGGAPEGALFLHDSRYVASSANLIPPVGVFVGTLRSVQFKPSEEHLTEQPPEIQDLLERPEIDVGGLVIVLSRGRKDVDDIARREGLAPLLSLAGVVVYRRWSTPGSAEPSDLEPLYRDKDYLLIYGDDAKIPPRVRRDFDLIFSQRLAHLFRRHASHATG